MKIQITTMLDGTYKCEVGNLVRITHSKTIAIQEVIKLARQSHDKYIRRADIMFYVEVPKTQPPPQEIGSPELKLLDLVKRGYLIPVPKDKPIIKYGITDEECEMIIKIREGDLIVLAQGPLPGKSEKVEPDHWGKSVIHKSSYGDGK